MKKNALLLRLLLLEVLMIDRLAHIIVLDADGNAIHNGMGQCAVEIGNGNRHIVPQSHEAQIFAIVLSIGAEHSKCVGLDHSTSWVSDP